VMSPSTNSSALPSMVAFITTFYSNSAQLFSTTAVPIRPQIDDFSPVGGCWHPRSPLFLQRP
jgi:hypothetical protein